IGDLDRDGKLDLAKVGVTLNGLVNLVLVGQNEPFHHVLQAWTGATGQPLEGFPKVIDDFGLTTVPLLANVGATVDPGDTLNLPELVSANGLYLVHAFDFTGREPASWPKLTGGWHTGSPAAGDVDDDGPLETAWPTREGNYFLRARGALRLPLLPRRTHHDPGGVRRRDAGGGAADAAPRQPRWRHVAGRGRSRLHGARRVPGGADRRRRRQPVAGDLARQLRLRAADHDHLDVDYDHARHVDHQHDGHDDEHHHHDDGQAAEDHHDHQQDDQQHHDHDAGGVRALRRHVQPGVRLLLGHLSRQGGS